ncbi:nucleotidyltransferase family protein [Pseudarthrobacter sp. J75]|uniref:nicotine blue oxidoreductase n=1 Tax=unclassified Pseudarthrobacter TaxID=2647000 RepID=UPI002E81E8A5|nr:MULTISPECIES: nucleotidyltransferase family protein [unclassified Pseudarthrobacter]MEE2522303.1 nucleotidyltransferase family protein [Pseudarthrobacter sp. J47]MEE2528051.1 nucleotidyltransferase family protein [Pseudarthrobacter sp. J75]
MQQAQHTTAVLLAAGAGTRLGRGPKALLPFRGRTLVEVQADVLFDGGIQHVVVVAGAGGEAVHKLPGLARCTVVDNPDWASGMAGSLRTGLAAADPADDVLIALVDQPGASPELVKRLLGNHRPGRVTAAAYQDAGGKIRRGHPLVIDASLRAGAAASATGDAGARAFLQANSGLVDLVDCSDLDTGADIDTPAQLPLLEP